jgi:hypothetical protein
VRICVRCFRASEASSLPWRADVAAVDDVKTVVAEGAVKGEGARRRWRGAHCERGGAVLGGSGPERCGGGVPGPPAKVSPQVKAIPVPGVASGV